MGKLLAFPSKQAQGMAYLETELRALLSARGADDELIEFACEQLTQTYQRTRNSEQFTFTLALPESLSDAEAEVLSSEIEAGLSTIQREAHSTIVRLIAELVLAQVKLFQQQRD